MNVLVGDSCLTLHDFRINETTVQVRGCFLVQSTPPLATEPKQAAERTAWQLAADSGRWSLAVVNPPAVWGPPLSSRGDGESVSVMARLLRGELWPAAPPLGSGWVDVRDVAVAHCLALLAPGAQAGRYLVSAASVYPVAFASKMLRRLYGPTSGLWLPPLVANYTTCLLFGPLLVRTSQLILSNHQHMQTCLLYTSV